MTRILLALLALLGIVAQTAPAEARVRVQETEIGVVAPARVSYLKMAAHAVRVVQPIPCAEAVAPSADEAFRAEAPRVFSPTVRIGVDRAVE